MKRIFMMLICLLLLTSCSKTNEDKLIKKFENDVNSSKSYTLKGSLEILNDEDSYNYLVEVSYKKKDMYKVKLSNTITNHEQIILKNKDEVYVITPSLNKSFKFQSEWPNNSSQAYILSSILSDLINTDNKNYMEDKDYYILTSDVNYPNNKDLVYQKLYFDKNNNLVKNEVYNSDNKLRIKFVVSSIDLKANLDDNLFNVENNVEHNLEADNRVLNPLNEIIYPLYIPSDTYLSSKETISIDNGNRNILTFSGNKEFVLIEEPTMLSQEFETIPVYGEPIMLNGNVGALSGNSIYFTLDNIDYYIAGNDLSTSELLSVASSLSNTLVTIAGK
ncbi:MAG: outer membrane lipoprotein carrier protein LolA [Firmicutes bacterium]|nr:outer membrane lipoprotein carrier protein LolA [Bacillota bacterium]